MPGPTRLHVAELRVAVELGRRHPYLVDLWHQRGTIRQVATTELCHCRTACDCGRIRHRLDQTPGTGISSLTFGVMRVQDKVLDVSSAGAS